MKSPPSKRSQLLISVLVVCLAIFVLGVACGVYYGRRMAPPEVVVRTEPAGKPLGSAITTRTSAYRSQLPAGVSTERLRLLKEEELPAVLAGLDADALLDLIEDADRIALGDGIGGGRQLRIAALTQLAKIDIDAALKICERRELRNSRYIVMTELARRDLGRMREMFDAAEDEYERTSLITWIALAETPEAARLISELLVDNPQYQVHGSRISSLASSLAAEDVDAAIAFYENLSKPKQREAALSPVLTALAAVDPQRALALMEAQIGSQLRPHFLSSIAQGWMKNDPAGARAWIDSLEDSRDISGAIKSLSAFAASRPEDRRWLAQTIAELPQNASHDYHAEYLSRQWAKYDPQGAVEWLWSLPPGKMRTRAIEDHGSNQIAQGWAKEHPAAAIAFLDSLDPEDPMKKYLTRSMMRGWSHADPAAAAAYAVEIGDQWSRDIAVKSIASYWSNSDPDAALAWASQIEEPYLQRRALGEVVSSTAENSPAEAAALLTEMIAGLKSDQLEQFEGTQLKIGQAWVARDPQAAVEWAIAQPAPYGNSERGPIGPTFESWIKVDPNAASDWLGQQAASPARDAAALRLIKETYLEDREVAFSWAATLENEIVAAEQLRTIVGGWNNPEAVRQAIAEAGIEGDVRQQLERILDRGF